MPGTPALRTGADTVLINAKVLTLDRQGTTATMLAIRDGLIVGLGSREDLGDWISKDTRTVDIEGHAVVPAFTDSHTHFQKGALQRRFFIDFLDASPTSIEEVLGTVSDRSLTTPAGQWIRGANLNEHHLADRRMPTRRELDGVADDHPVVIYGTGNHTASANSRALALAGIDRSTADPPGGVIDRDEVGEPTGILHERAKLRLDPNQPHTVLPSLTAENRIEAIAAESSYLHESGIGMIYDMVSTAEEIGAYMTLWEKGALPFRVGLLTRIVESQIALDDVLALGLRQPFGDSWLHFSGVKVSVDGICAWRNAAVYESYPGEADNFGLVRIPPPDLTAAVSAAHAAGVRVAVHAIGQRAVDMALDAFELAKSRQPSPLRHRIEHAYLPPRPGQLERIKSLGLTVSTQPSFLRELGDAWIEIWGESEVSDALPLREMLDMRIPVVLSSDYPCVPASPIAGMATAVDRRTRSGRTLGSGQALTIREALAGFTVEAARADNLDHRRGTLEVGKEADLIVLSADPVSVGPDELRQVRVLLTMVAGRIVYATDGFAGLTD